MTYLRNSVLLTLIIIFHFSCEDDSTKSTANIRTCHSDMNWDVEQIRNTMIGEWRWIHSNCVFLGLVDVPDDSISFEFMDSLVEIRDKGVLFQTSVWNIEINPHGEFVINFEPTEFLFYGRIYLCENELFTTDDFISDDCENHFVRQE